MPASEARKAAIRIPIQQAEGDYGEGNHSASNPGPINKVLIGDNPDSYLPPTTDRGYVLPIWYSLDLVHRRIEDGGWNFG